MDLLRRAWHKVWACPICHFTAAKSTTAANVSRASAPEPNRIWSNWARIHQCTPRLTHRPSSEEELREVVEEALARGLKIKVVGSGHSPNDIALTGDFQVQLNRFNRLLLLDRRRCRVTVEAGITLQQLNELLWEHSLALPNLGSISEQTIAGAIATGTHGTGARFANLASFVRRLRVLQLPTRSGEPCIAHECSPEQNPELFKAALCGLGLMGIVTEVTLECEPAFFLREETRRASLHTVLEDLDRLNEDNEHMRFFWFPHSDAAVLYTQNRAHAVDAVKQEAATAATPACARSLGRLPGATLICWLWRTVFGWLWAHLLGFHGLELALWLGIWVPALVPHINRLWARLFYPERTRVERSFDVFNFDCLFKQHVNEWAIPKERCAEALRRLEQLIHREKFRVHFPIEVRFVAADDQWLSPASGFDTCWIGIIMYRPFGCETEYQRYFAAFERLMTELGGRPHWAKAFVMSPAELARRYPNFGRWAELRREMDPADLLMNDYGRRLFQ